MVSPVSRDIYQGNPFLNLPRDALIEVVKRLCTYRLSSGHEIVRFGRVCVLAYEISKNPVFTQAVQDAQTVFRLNQEVKALNNQLFAM